MKDEAKILFISGSIGLGHVTRDLAIVEELRARRPGWRVVWLAADPARGVLREAGEELAPECRQFTGETDLVEELGGEYSLPLTQPTAWLKSPRLWRSFFRLWRHQRRNVAIFQKLTRREGFDLAIGDEAYEIMLELARRPALKPRRLAMLFDFVGIDAVSRSLWERVTVQMASWYGERLVRRLPRMFDLTLMIGEEEDVEDKPFGWRQANRRELARSMVKFVGYALPFKPAEFQDRVRLKQQLGYGTEPFIICSIGGTAVGAALLQLCGRAYPLLKKKIPHLRMVAVCGPRISPEELQLPVEIERRGYVHRLYEHLAACDLAIVQGGGTTTLELTALRRPFLYFPLADHFEQRLHVAKRIERHGAGVKLEFASTTPECLAAEVLAHIGEEAGYPPIRSDGAARAADLLVDLMAVKAER